MLGGPGVKSGRKTGITGVDRSGLGCLIQSREVPEGFLEGEPVKHRRGSPRAGGGGECSSKGGGWAKARPY